MIDEGLDNAVRHAPANTTPTTFHRWCEDELKPAILGWSSPVGDTA